MAWLVIIALLLDALATTWETLTARKAVVIRLEPIIYLWAAWFIYVHM